jgi:hypothetical protein
VVLPSIDEADIGNGATEDPASIEDIAKLTIRRVEATDGEVSEHAKDKCLISMLNMDVGAEFQVTRCGGIIVPRRFVDTWLQNRNSCLLYRRTSRKWFVLVRGRNPIRWDL